MEQQQLRFPSKTATVAANIFTVFGTVISLLLLEKSIVGGFDWYKFLPAVCYLISLGALAGYAFSKEMKSSTAFNSVLISYGLVLLVTGILFPPVFPHGTKPLFVAFSVIIIMGFFLLVKFWNSLKITGTLFAVFIILELISSFSALLGNPMMRNGSFIEKSSLFVRPVILGAFAICYLTRIYEKFKKD